MRDYTRLCWKRLQVERARGTTVPLRTLVERTTERAAKNLL
jgi:hypothetical protein